MTETLHGILKHGTTFLLILSFINEATYKNIQGYLISARTDFSQHIDFSFLFGIK